MGVEVIDALVAASPALLDHGEGSLGLLLAIVPQAWPSYVTGSFGLRPSKPRFVRKAI